jgi:antitoxin HicB
LAWPVTLEPAEEGGFIINFPDFAEGWSQSESHEEALAQAADLLETMVANYMAESWELPEPSSPAGRPVVALAPMVAAKAELYRAMRGNGMTKADLADRLGISPQQIRRLFDLRSAPRLDHIEAAMRALGRRLVVTSDAA